MKVKKFQMFSYSYKKWAILDMGHFVTGLLWYQVILELGCMDHSAYL